MRYGTPNCGSKTTEAAFTAPLSGWMFGGHSRCSDSIGPVREDVERLLLTPSPTSEVVVDNGLRLLLPTN